MEKEEKVTENKNEEKSGSDGSLPNTNVKRKEGAERSDEPMAQEKDQGESQPTLRPRAQWTAKGDARSDQEADAEWHKANALLFRPSYEAWHKKEKFQEKMVNLERKLANQDWQDDENRRNETVTC